ncbi:uncharacterized protein PITG_19080 [Phytophthora infestans T30-4]|uniref:Uncharacterized protein n=1 Tax=Phytophthora infestans (strain T30-4) TaxID=403677 RepID=D0P003_PHYIT|nr:uncharacterized protein PITG_19080 [Phytophthora infestans T30-4]EEY70162.1 conserved hypothetical protein [Phytophthora infestans T30-4]|eukprot:XP_002997063.1 conserved hypothetical protein [Phytophthora infestans T30-4]
MSLDTPVIHRRPSTRLLELCTNRSTMDTFMVVSSRPEMNANLLNAASDRQQPTEAAKRAMDISKRPTELDACKFASADSRPYPMMPALVQNEEESKEGEPEPNIYPIPANEEVRMAAIEHFRLHDVANVSELNVICSLAAAEMKAPHSVVTLVET